MKSTGRILALLLSAILLLSTMGCQTILAPAESTPITVDVAGQTPDPGDVVAAEPTPETTATPDPDIGAQFDALDLEIFKWYATTDGYTFHQLITDPEALGISRENVEMTLGDFSIEGDQEYALAATAYLEQLALIPRSRLNPAQQLSYDIIEQYLQSVVESMEFPYYAEPLTEYSGLHGNLPLSFVLFNIDSLQDAEDYLTLFADVPRYLGQVLAYEQKRAELGMFMTENALDTILSGCKDIIDSKDNSYLYATFNEAVDNVSSISAVDAEALKARNSQLIQNDFINAYRMLYNGLDDLRSKCSKEVGAYAGGETALAYYEMTMQARSNSQLSVEEALEMLQDEFNYLLARYFEIDEENPELMAQFANTKITSGNTEQDLALLKEITAKILPELPDHELLVIDVPEELESLMSPAAYEIPSVDDSYHNQVLINPASPSNTMLLTLAHEAYPGHLYQYVYQRGLEDVGYMQRALHFGGYAEGWSQFSEQLIIENQTAYNKAYCEMENYNSIICNVLLPSMTSIWVNYQGYDQKSVELKLQPIFGSNAEAIAKSFYDLAVEQPYYTFYYALGYCQLWNLVRDAQADLGDAFDQKAFLTAYLDLGPGYFNLINERMDVWVDEHVLEMLD